MESGRDAEKSSGMNLIGAAAWPQETFLSPSQAKHAHDEPEPAHASTPAPVTPVDPAMTYGCVDWFLYPGTANRNH